MVPELVLVIGAYPDMLPSVKLCPSTRGPDCKGIVGVRYNNPCGLRKVDASYTEHGPDVRTDDAAIGIPGVNRTALGGVLTQPAISRRNAIVDGVADGFNAQALQGPKGTVGQPVGPSRNADHSRVRPKIGAEIGESGTNDKGCATLTSGRGDLGIDGNYRSDKQRCDDEPRDGLRTHGLSSRLNKCPPPKQYPFGGRVIHRFSKGARQKLSSSENAYWAKCRR